LSPDSNKRWADSHSHLADVRWGLEPASLSFHHPVIDRAIDQGIHFFLQGGVGPDDWQRQKELKRRYPQVGLCFGLHPYFVSEKSWDDCENALDVLAREIRLAQALGELGLDFRPHVVKDKEAQQLEFFCLQLELAEFAKKPVVLHLVRAFDKIKEIFSVMGAPAYGGLVHSFNGSAKEAEYYLSQGLHLSVGGPLCRSDNQKLRQAVQAIPLDKILLESDSPDQPSPKFLHQMNEPLCIFEVAEIIAEIKKTSKEEVLDIATQNLEKLLHGTKLTESAL
jgi:TatD DNase family protein